MGKQNDKAGIRSCLMLDLAGPVAPHSTRPLTRTRQGDRSNLRDSWKSYFITASSVYFLVISLNCWPKARLKMICHCDDGPPTVNGLNSRKEWEIVVDFSRQSWNGKVIERFSPRFIIFKEIKLLEMKEIVNIDSITEVPFNYST